MILKKWIGAAVGIIGISCSVALGDYDFTAITNNDPNNVVIGEAQFWMSVSDLGSNQVLFEISNSGPEPSSIRLVAFDGDVLEAFNSVINGSGVSFSIDGSPSDMPNASSVGFSADFSASANPPPASNGVNPSQLVSFVMQANYAAVIAALNSGELRVGMHAISIGDSANSEAFVNVVPAPGAVALLALAAFISRRRRRTDTPTL